MTCRRSRGRPSARILHPNNASRAPNAAAPLLPGPARRRPPGPGGRTAGNASALESTAGGRRSRRRTTWRRLWRISCAEPGPRGCPGRASARTDGSGRTRSHSPGSGSHSRSASSTAARWRSATISTETAVRKGAASVPTVGFRRPDSRRTTAADGQPFGRSVASGTEADVRQVFGCYDDRRVMSKDKHMSDVFDVLFCV
jgi:hypothetical protein